MISKFMAVSKRKEEYLNALPILFLRLVNKTLKGVVDSIIYRALEFQFDDYSISRQGKFTKYKNHFGFFDVQLKFSTHFDFDGGIINRFDNKFGRPDRNHRPFVILLHRQFDLGKDIFQNTRHLYIYSIPIHSDREKKSATLLPSSTCLVPKNFPKLQLVTLYLTNERLSNRCTNALRNFFIYFRKAKNSQPLKVNLHIKSGASSSSRLPFSLIKLLEIEDLVVSFKVARRTSSLKSLKILSHFTNLKTFEIYETDAKSSFEFFTTKHEVLQNLTSLNELKIYSSVYLCNPLKAHSFIPPNITKLTIHYDALLVEMLKRPDRQDLCSGLLNITHLQVYATVYDDIYERLYMPSVHIGSNAEFNLVLPKLESLETYIPAKHNYRHRHAFCQIMIANKNTIKNLSMFRDNFLIPEDIEDDLNKIEEFSMVIMEKYSPELREKYDTILNRMTNLKILSLYHPRNKKCSAVLFDIILENLTLTNSFPSLEIVDYLFPFDIEPCEPGRFNLEMYLVMVGIDLRFDAFFKESCYLVPFLMNCLTLVLEEGPTYPVGEKNMMYARGHFFLDIKQARNVIAQRKF